MELCIRISCRFFNQVVFAIFVVDAGLNGKVFYLIPQTTSDQEIPVSSGAQITNIIRIQTSGDTTKGVWHRAFYGIIQYIRLRRIENMVTDTCIDKGFYIPFRELVFQLNRNAEILIGLSRRYTLVIENHLLLEKLMLLKSETSADVKIIDKVIGTPQGKVYTRPRLVTRGLIGYRSIAMIIKN